jgi:hypothetical protein
MVLHVERFGLKTIVKGEGIPALVETHLPINGIYSKARIPGVTVTTIDVDTGEKLTALTDGAGRYRFSSVKTGKYTMVSSLPGFTTMTVSDLNVGDTQLLQNFTIGPPGVQRRAMRSLYTFPYF